MGHIDLAVALDGIILAQRMTFPVFRHLNAPQIGMSVETDAEQIEDLALEEVGARPDRRERFDGRASPLSRTFSRTVPSWGSKAVGK